MDTELDALLTGTQAAAYIRESKQLIRKWRVTDKLKPADFTRAGAPLYRLRDVLEVERATRNTKQSSRNPCHAL